MWVGEAFTHPTIILTGFYAYGGETWYFFSTFFSTFLGVKRDVALVSNSGHLSLSFPTILLRYVPEDSYKFPTFSYIFFLEKSNEKFAT